MKVEARYRGKERYYPGRIRRDNRDGTYDIDYDDGEKEMRVDKAFIKVVDAPSTPGRRSGGEGRLEEGMKVEANYRGKGRYYPGRIRRDNHDGTCDIDYDDGEKEASVRVDFIRALDGGGSGGGGSSFREGEKVEARYRGKARYYPGRINRDNRDGTYDIDYDDGEKERGVQGELIKSMEGGGGGGGGGLATPSRPTSARPGSGRSGLREGMKVNARYRGKQRMYPGRIARANFDGTYDIDYDDGEKEIGVREDLIQPLDGFSVTSPRVSPRSNRSARSFQRGDKIEAKYRGKARYYSGRIAGPGRRDGTYDIDYDDGEKEVDVIAEYIRHLG